MSNDHLDKAANAIKHVVDDVKDKLHETQHHAAADAEKARRDNLGDTMTVGEKIGSVANEAKQRTQAEIDAAKHNIRDNT